MRVAAPWGFTSQKQWPSRAGWSSGGLCGRAQPYQSGGSSKEEAPSRTQLCEVQLALQELPRVTKGPLELRPGVASLSQCEKISREQLKQLENSTESATSHTGSAHGVGWTAGETEPLRRVEDAVWVELHAGRRTHVHWSVIMNGVREEGLGAGTCCPQRRKRAAKHGWSSGVRSRGLQGDPAYIG